MFGPYRVYFNSDNDTEAVRAGWARLPRQLTLGLVEGEAEPRIRAKVPPGLVLVVLDGGALTGASGVA